MHQSVLAATTTKHGQLARAAEQAVQQDDNICDTSYSSTGAAVTPATIYNAAAAWVTKTAADLRA